ncbi:hypothetical protein DXZ79_01780 [Yersinia rochesterensis]|uniref:Uncharacterized protein n=1 Tax=Yersinia rochesterensis TaxID=1604335 RepID=A0A8D4MZ06_9GAMM|nr:hypothetical protein DXZ79_01780 [Yersinia rochesterensis]
MFCLPAGARLVDCYPVELDNKPRCRSISDDDICAWCSNLYYRPSETSLCRLMSEDNDWPAYFDADGYAQSCTQLQLIFTASRSSLD